MKHLRKVALITLLLLLTVNTFFLLTSSNYAIPENPNEIPLRTSSGDVDYLFERNILYNETNPIPDLTANIKNQTLFTDIYNASYSFTNDVDGTIPQGFSDISTIASTAQIISSFEGHDKVLELYDVDGGQSGVRSWIANETSGIYEFWFYTTGNNKYTQWLFWDLGENTGINFLVEFNTGKFSFHNGTINDITTHTPSTFYHIKIIYDFAVDWEVYINGEGFTGLSWAGVPDQVDKIDIQTETTPTSFYSYIDAIGFDVYGNYTEDDNIIPYHYTSNTTEIDKWEFFNNEDGTATVNAQQDIPYFTELASIGYITKNIAEFEDETGVYFPIGDADHEGIYRSIDIATAKVINVQWHILGSQWKMGTAKTYCYFDIDSFDDTLISRLRIDDDAVQGALKLSYFYGGSYVELLPINLPPLEYIFNITIVENIVRLDVVKEDSFHYTYYFPTIVENKAGIGDVLYEGYLSFLDPANWGMLIDSIGVYIDNSSVCNDFSNYYYDTGDDYDHSWQNLFTMNATGFFGASMISFSMSPQIHSFFPYQNVSDISFINTYKNHQNGVSLNAYFTVITNTTFALNNIIIEGVIMREGSNLIHPTYTDGGVDNNITYWRVVDDRLTYILINNDGGTEYTSISFDITDIPTFNYTYMFTGNNFNLFGRELRLNYNDATTSVIPISYGLRVERFYYPSNDKIVESLEILITDDDLYNDYNSTGYFFDFIARPSTEHGIDISTSNFMTALVPLLFFILVPSLIVIYSLNKTEASDETREKMFVPVLAVFCFIAYAFAQVDLWMLFLMIIGFATLFLANRGSS